MIFDSALQAFNRLFTRPFRSMLWKSLGLTLLFLVIIWFSFRHIFILYLWPVFENFLPGFPAWLGWIGVVAFFTLSLSLAFLLTFFITPITAFIGSFFIDQAVEIIEKEDFPEQEKGQPLAFGFSLLLSIRFLAISILCNLCILLLIFFPILHLIAFYGLNAYLLGKEYFILNALRFHNEKEAHTYYQDHKFTIIPAGFFITLFLSIPILNLLTPLFAASMMAYLYKNLMLNQTKNKITKTPPNKQPVKRIVFNESQLDILPPKKD